VIPSQFLGIYANPDDTQISLTQTPAAAITTVPNQYLTLTIKATNTAGFPQSYQWQRWDTATSTFTNIPGAVGAGAGTFVYGPTTMADNGIQIRAVAYAPGVSASAVTTLTVIPDNVSPTVASAAGEGTLTKVYLTFSEPMNTADPSFTEAIFYTMSGGGIDYSFSQATVVSPTTVLLTVDSATLADGVVYTVTAPEGITDANGNLLDPTHATAQFTSWVRSPVMAKYEFWFNVNGGVVNDLLNNARYPNSPDLAYNTNSLDFPATNPNTENYGLRMSGYFRPPTSGNYTFYIKNDDAARFQLSTDQSAANLRTIIDVGCCNSAFAAGTVVPGLVAGNAYYFEAIVKEAGGGDYLTIGVKAPGGVDILPVDGVYLANAIDASLLTINPGISQQPLSISRVENSSATFTVAVTNVGSFGATYQWQANSGAGFADIVGATGTSYTKGPLTLADNGVQYRVLVIVPGKTLTSATATLTVTADSVKPTLISASSANGTQVGVRFSEAVSQATAEEEINYDVSGAQPTSAILRPDGTTVVLTFDAPVPRNFTLAVTGISDRAATANTINDTNIAGKWWNDAVVDIANPNPPGQHFSAAEGEIEISAGGNDVWGTSDQFTYAYTPRSSDFDVKVRVDSIQYVGNAWSKAGLNIRESTAPDSKMVWFYPTPTLGSAQFEGAVRPNNGSDVLDFGQPRPAVYFPAWLRAIRSGSSFSAYLSPDGTNWTQFGATQDLPQFPSTVLVGLGAVSHVDGTATVAKFSQFSAVAHLTVGKVGNNLVISWDGLGTLESADAITGPWTTVAGATNPYTVPIAPTGTKYYRVKLPTP